MNDGLIDFGERAIKPMSRLMDELTGLLAEDAEALGTLEEIVRLRRIAEEGTSSTRQRRVHAEARARGATAAFLEVAADNAGAAALYRRLDWVEAGRRKGYVRRLDGGRVDALVMRLDLG